MSTLDFWPVTLSDYFSVPPPCPSLPRSRFLDIQKTAAREINPIPQLPLTFLLLSGDLRSGNDKDSRENAIFKKPFCVMFNR